MEFILQNWGQVTKTANTSYVIPANGIATDTILSAPDQFCYYTRVDTLAQLTAADYFISIVRSIKLFDTVKCTIVQPGVGVQIVDLYFSDINYGVDNINDATVTASVIGANFISSDVTVSPAQWLALSTANLVTLVPAPGPGKYNIFHGAVFFSTVGTAYGNVVNNPFSICHGNVTPTEYGTIAAVGFLDQAGQSFVQAEAGKAASNATAIVQEVPLSPTQFVNQPLYLTKPAGTGFYTLGTKSTLVRTYYSIF